MYAKGASAEAVEAVAKRAMGLDDRGIQKVWMGDRLIWDKATDPRSPAEAIGLVLFGGAEDVGQGSGDLCTGGGDG